MARRRRGLADFAAHPADPFAGTADVLAGLLPVLTVVGGRARHDPDRLATPGGAPEAGILLWRQW
jgi:hypothetical protein